jgi:hypothetical protein
MNRGSMDVTAELVAVARASPARSSVVAESKSPVEPN